MYVRVQLCFASALVDVGRRPAGRNFANLRSEKLITNHSHPVPPSVTQSPLGMDRYSLSVEPSNCESTTNSPVHSVHVIESDAGRYGRAAKPCWRAHARAARDLKVSDFSIATLRLSRSDRGGGSQQTAASIMSKRWWFSTVSQTDRPADGAEMASTRATSCGLARTGNGLWPTPGTLRRALP